MADRTPCSAFDGIAHVVAEDPDNQEWSPCLFCGAPLAILPEPWWPDDVWRRLAEERAGGFAIDLTDDDGQPVSQWISGGTWVTLLMMLGEDLRSLNQALVDANRLHDLESALDSLYRWR